MFSPVFKSSKQLEKQLDPKISECSESAKMSIWQAMLEGKSEILKVQKLCAVAFRRARAAKYKQEKALMKQQAKADGKFVAKRPATKVHSQKKAKKSVPLPILK